jgi:hypothetical protein
MLDAEVEFAAAVAGFDVAGAAALVAGAEDAAGLLALLLQAPRERVARAAAATRVAVDLRVGENMVRSCWVRELMSC